MQQTTHVAHIYLLPLFLGKNMTFFFSTFRIFITFA